MVKIVLLIVSAINLAIQIYTFVVLSRIDPEDILSRIDKDLDDSDN